MNLSFLTPAGSAVPESPLLAAARRDGAACEVRDGWLVPVRFAGGRAEADALADTVAWGDASPRGKFALHESRPRRRHQGCWWCPIAPALTLVVADGDRVADVRAELADRALDVTTQYAALLIAGPLARETIARFCSIDLRGAAAGAFHPGSIARTPGYVLCEGRDRFLLMFGAALAEYVWTVVSDAGRSQGGTPAGWDLLTPSRAPGPAPAEETAHA